MTTERKLIRELRDSIKWNDGHVLVSVDPSVLAKADAYLATPEVDGLAPIQQDEVMSRSYIPLPGGWEIQTKGSGSTFRLYDGRNDFRLPIADQPYLFDMLERMARDIHAAFTTPCPNIATSREGTSYCRLAESGAMNMEKVLDLVQSVDDLLGALNKPWDEKRIDLILSLDGMKTARAALTQPEKSP